MPNIRLHHDVAAACATAILEKVSPGLHDDQRRDAWSMFDEAVKAALVRYDLHREREAARFGKPAPNGQWTNV